MATESSDAFRARATQARRISDNMQNDEARIELRDMADALDTEADRLEREQTPNAIPPLTNDV